MKAAWQELYGRVGMVGIIFAVTILAGVFVWLVVGVPAPTSHLCYPHCR